MTDTDTPPPMVPAEVDLRDYDEFPLEFDRVFDSDTWTLWNDRERVVGLRLWCKSWHQEPCGSLPTDDRLLAKLAGYGDAVREWLKVKKAVLSGWLLCSDGRLYHPVVAEKAINKWRTKRRKENDNAADAERKRRKRAKSPPGQKPGNDTSSGGSSGGQSHNVHPDIDAVEEKGREEKEEKNSEATASGAGAPSLEAEVFRRGKEVFGKAAGGQITKLRQCVRDDMAVLALINEGKTKENPSEWLAGVLKNRGKNPDTDSLGLPVRERYDAMEEYRRAGVLI
ncbi:MAG TPA: hypothetical protein VG271_13450 [Beijerinckiaceae bacterium]|jgi:hypothetical protein|nr:hypothetical protein [Beijerinckiaceae bacterium]